MMQGSSKMNVQTGMQTKREQKSQEYSREACYTKLHRRPMKPWDGKAAACRPAEVQRMKSLPKMPVSSHLEGTG